MKKLIIIISLLISASVGITQSTHTLTATDYYFSPDTLYVQQGDTIELINIGYHSITEVDSIDWVNNTANHNGGFYVGVGAPTLSDKFTIDNEGTYYNLCFPHATMGMKSIIIVETTTTGVHQLNSEQNIQIYPNPASNSITVENTSTVKIYNMMGQVLFVRSKLNSLEQIDISFLPKGIYNVFLDGRIHLLIVQ
jgi:plastocyanin